MNFTKWAVTHQVVLSLTKANNYWTDVNKLLKIFQYLVFYTRLQVLLGLSLYGQFISIILGACFWSFKTQIYKLQKFDDVCLLDFKEFASVVSVNIQHCSTFSFSLVTPLSFMCLLGLEEKHFEGKQFPIL